jgi:hypothetical protein
VLFDIILPGIRPFLVVRGIVYIRYIALRLTIQEEAEPMVVGCGGSVRRGVGVRKFDDEKDSRRRGAGRRNGAAIEEMWEGYGMWKVGRRCGASGDET